MASSLQTTVSWTWSEARDPRRQPYQRSERFCVRPEPNHPSLSSAVQTALWRSLNMSGHYSPPSASTFQPSSLFALVNPALGPLPSPHSYAKSAYRKFPLCQAARLIHCCWNSARSLSYFLKYLFRFTRDLIIYFLSSLSYVCFFSLSRGASGWIHTPVIAIHLYNNHKIVINRQTRCPYSHTLFSNNMGQALKLDNILPIMLLDSTSDLLPGANPDLQTRLSVKKYANVLNSLLKRETFLSLPPPSTR